MAQRGASKGRKTLAKSQFNDSLAEDLSQTTHFTAEECRALLHTFDNLAMANTGKLDRLRFREFLHSCFELTDDLMLDLTFRGFDKNADGTVDQSEFVRGLSVMMRGDTEECTEFVYSVYDMNGDGGLAREELHQCLKGCFTSGYGLESDEMEEAEREIVEIAMKKLDVNRDGQITFDDFQNSVKTDPLLIQACGPCLISQKCMARFLFLVTWDYRAFSSDLFDTTILRKKKTDRSKSSTKSSTGSAANVDRGSVVNNSVIA